MTQTERVNVGDLRRVTELANLELTAPEEVSMLRDLNSILDHVAQLNELNTAIVPAMAQVNEVLTGVSSASTLCREDEEIPCLDRALVMTGAPDSDGIFFRVPKVIAQGN
jgi:aspartyl-tRNA(Asn)/glutamyl-tRNA(Gln) amidotransferase subunit C